MSKKHIVNSASSARRMQEIVLELFDKEKYVTFTWSTGPLSSMPQKALLHIWLRTTVSRLVKCAEKDVSVEEVESLKRTLKAYFYHETAAEWMMTQMRELVPPYRTRSEYSSSSKWTRGQMYEFLTWFQMWAANRGIVLESSGEYAEMRKSENG